MSECAESHEITHSRRLSRYTAVSGVRDVHIMLIVNCRAQRRGSRIIPSSANIFTVRGHLTTLTSVQQSARRRL